MFEIEGKVALVTGGVSGIGLAITKTLLENGLKAVALVDINEENGKVVLEDIKKQYGDSKAMFIKTDIGDKNQFDSAFKSTVKAFQNLDIVVNSAAYANDQNWEKTIETNLIGTVTGIILAIEDYLPKFKTGCDAVILNVASLAAIKTFSGQPVYNTTKSGIVKFTRCMGTKVHYDRTKVRVMAICPGLTETPFIQLKENTLLHDDYHTILDQEIDYKSIQTVINVSKAAIQVIKEGTSGSIWVVKDNEPAYEIEFVQSMIMFNISGKVALVTGGASGIGLATVDKLLKEEIKGVTIADTNEIIGLQVAEKLNQKYGDKKVLFVKVDVAHRNEFEDAFKYTVDAFQNLDIVINCAGIVKDLIWEEEIMVNLGGTITGTYFAFEKYLPKYKSGSEGVIINVSSIAALDVFAYAPVYSATKSGVVALSRSFGSPTHYNRNQIRVMAICPGYTDTPIHREYPERLLGPVFFDLKPQEMSNVVLQPPEYVAKTIIVMIKEGKNGSVWVSENNETPYEMNFFHREESKL
ncbi:hypothetical protein RN001_009155 [Aquatica leii]|uniref:Uncharacterized protein n=1 Tax=Aquatica leii TaxID=1421715 RepID=A0AAN7PTG6_9COLE|nr:hypothetical protein RN001_009155 [Aquatica leii]